MTARPLVIFPDPRLRLRASPVTAFGREVADLARDIVDTMSAFSAIGLAAPHIGVPRRVVVVRLDPREEPQTYVNPMITWASPDLALNEEGSVSMPGVRETVERPAGVALSYQTLSGEQREAQAEGLLAATIQHEIDQIDGLFWTARLSRLKRGRIETRFRKLGRRETNPPGGP